MQKTRSKIINQITVDGDITVLLLREGVQGFYSNIPNFPL
jgi:hypothetical protein